MKRIGRINVALFLIPLLICSLSTLLLLSLDLDLTKRQVLFFIVGYLCYFLISNIDFDIILLFWKHIYLVVLALLTATKFLGESVRGSVRWLNLNGFGFQPSEFAKISLIIFLSGFLASRRGEKLDARSIILSALIIFPLILLTLRQPDFGTALVMLLIYFVTLFIRGVNAKFMFFCFVLLGIVSGPLWNGLKVYQKERILVFVNPYLDPLGSGYNVVQSRIAVGSGMFFGKGYGHGTQSRLRFLPEYHTDFVFASFSEEFGLVGVTLLLVLFFLLLLSIIKIAENTKDMAGLLLSCGVFTSILLQLFVNIGMNLGLLPVTGIPLPLFSYGGSSIISTFAALGLVSSVWKKSLRLDSKS